MLDAPFLRAFSDIVIMSHLRYCWFLKVSNPTDLYLIIIFESYCLVCQYQRSQALLRSSLPFRSLICFRCNALTAAANSGSVDLTGPATGHTTRGTSLAVDLIRGVSHHRQLCFRPAVMAFNTRKILISCHSQEEGPACKLPYLHTLSCQAQSHLNEGLHVTKWRKNHSSQRPHLWCRQNARLCNCGCLKAVLLQDLGENAAYLTRALGVRSACRFSPCGFQGEWQPLTHSLKIVPSSLGVSETYLWRSKCLQLLLKVRTGSKMG